MERIIDMDEIIHISANASIGEKYDPAMKMTDPEKAKCYFEACVLHNMLISNHSRKKAVEIEKANLGYYAGYCGHETRKRVERLFECEHPIFGPISKGRPTAQEAFDMGKKLASKQLKDFERAKTKDDTDPI